MKNKLVESFLIVGIVILLAVGFCYFSDGKINIFLKNENQNQAVQKELGAKEIMEIIKTDKDYNDLADFVKNFDEIEVVDYKKLGLNEYKNIKEMWQAENLDDRIALVDKINLTDSTYWIEVKNRTDTTKGLRMVLDTKENKSLLLIATMSISAGIGI